MLVFLLSLGLTLGSFGCGSKKAAPAQISGTVKYNGQPVTGGTLVFFTKGGVYPSAISTDGTYTAIDLPEGEATVTVDTEALNPDHKKVEYSVKTAGSGGDGAKYGGSKGYGGGKGGGAQPFAKPPAVGGGKQDRSPAGEGSPQGEAGTYVKIPRTYADKDKSPLKLVLKEGSQHQDLELKD